MPASEERSISEFPSALNILATTLLLVSTYDSGNDSYDSEKVTAVDLASAILGDFEYTQDLATNVKTIFGAINSIMVLSGTTVPSSDIGSNGQLYFKYSSSGGTDTVDAMYWKINDAWCEVATGGGGGGASVTLGTTVPSDASGSNGDLYVQYDGTTYAVIEYFVKINGSWRKSPYSRVVALTQAEYNLITPDPTTLYIITDKQGSYVKLPVITDAYDSTATYNTGDLCIYNDTLYKCNTDNTTGTWVSQYWDATSIADEINGLKSGKQDVLTPTQTDGAYSSSITINKNDKELKIRKYGKMVTIEGFFQAKADIPANTVISATGLTFLGQAQFVGFGGSGNLPIPFTISQSGNLTVLASIANNAWVNFCVTNLLA